jgi:tetratricopeptide (TPR) repeat protein
VIKDFKFGEGFDRTNALIGGFVFLFSFIIYRMTVAPTLSFWDCGEFIASAYILGIPHPPGSPLFVVIGRVFSVLPIAADICLRINLISVISSALTALFGYLVLVRIIKYWYQETVFDGWKKVVAYSGGVVGSLMMAFSSTNWGNAVEAEVYGLSMLTMTIIFWLMLQFFDSRGTSKAERIIVLACYLGMLGIAIHLTTFLIVPIAAIFFILKKDAPPRAWVALCGFFVAELLAIILVANKTGAYQLFMGLSVLLIGALIIFIYRHINWPVLIGIGSFAMIMVGFHEFIFGLIGGILLIVLIAAKAKDSDWRTGLIIMLAAVIGFSFHLFIPIRAAEKPMINENSAYRSYKIFVDFLERKQYGRESMVERMFARRAEWGNQFGRHANMGFWSYFEEQYSSPKAFLVLFPMGLFGIWYAIRKKLEIGLPFLVLLLLGSVGLVLYMNFADGIMYNSTTGDAYQEVRNRDYFFTPAFMYFGLAMGLGAAAIMEVIRSKTSQAKLIQFQRPAMMVSLVLLLLPSLAISHNYFTSDRSRNYYPYNYAYNILQSCEKDAILFTSGDNDTFPLWCVQEVYNLRKDVRVVNLSLFNTDWYVYQMKNQYNVPIGLKDEQILWETYEYDGREIQRPKEMFYDRPRKRQTYLVPMPHEGRVVKLQDMMVDEVVLNNDWKVPIYFTSEPYAESPLKLRDLAVADGVVYRLVKNPPARKIDLDHGLHLFNTVYKYDGLNDNNIYRDENASGVMMGLAFNALRITDELQRVGRPEEAKSFLLEITDKYPEFFQTYVTLSQIYKKEGDTAKATAILVRMENTLTALLKRNPSSLFYMQDLGLAKYYQGKTEEALKYLWAAFEANPNSGYAYRKLMQALIEIQRNSDIIRATRMHANYKINRGDPLVQQILSQTNLLRDTP